MSVYIKQNIKQTNINDSSFSFDEIKFLWWV